MRLAMTIFSLASMCFIVGCETVTVTSTTGAPMPPRPVSGPSTPVGVPVTNVVVICPYAMVDINGDGQNAEFPFAVYLYSQPYPAPKWEGGSCLLKLYPMGALREVGAENTILAEWRWDSSEVLKARQHNLVGDFYRFEVDLTDLEFDDSTASGFDFQVVFASDEGGMACESKIKTVRVR